MNQEAAKSRFKAQFGGRPRSIRWLLHVLVLWSFAVAQPLYAKIAENLPFLISHKVDGLALVIYALGILLVPPLLIWGAVGLTAAVSQRLAAIAQRVMIIVLISAALLPILLGSGLPDGMGVALSLGLALIPALFYRTKLWSGLLDILTPAPAVFVAIFLFVSPASALLTTDELKPAEKSADNLEIPVVILLLDELSTQALLDASGDLDSARLPGFSRLAEVSTWYPRATTVVEATTMAAPVFLSGILPIDGRRQPPIYQSFPENIFDHVSPQRRIRAVENGSRLCRPGRCDFGIDSDSSVRSVHWQALVADSSVIWAHITLPQSLRSRWLPELGARWAGFANVGNGASPGQKDSGPRDIRWGKRDSEFTSFMNAIEDVGPGTMYYQHLLLPHAPWIYLADGRAYDTPKGDSINGMMPDAANDTGVKHMWWNSEWATIVGEQRFLMQVGYVDSLVEQIMERLSASDYFDEMMLVVAADHGGSFTPGTSRRALTQENFAEILPIPLFIKYPGQLDGRIDKQPAELVDVSPTIRRTLGLSAAGLDGQPLQDQSER
ncbi:MAG TPA: sulfatase-like hydrolase/transferase, partial [Wenzhouxiangella sp.]|nr:sulfatase-like hydrolase/transferase [Wenzhouxiangella sp.]